MRTRTDVDSPITFRKCVHSPSILKRLLKGEGGVQQNDRTLAHL